MASARAQSVRELLGEKKDAHAAQHTVRQRAAITRARDVGVGHKAFIPEITETLERDESSISPRSEEHTSELQSQ
mgnify:CR=1 FL=1